MNETIPAAARPTTPCDATICPSELSTRQEICGNRWGTPWREEPEYPECTECHHVCAHYTPHGEPDEVPFRFLAGPEIAALIGQTPGEIIQGLVDEAETTQDVEWSTFSFTVPPQPIQLVVRANHWQEAGDALRHFVIPPEGVLLIPEPITDA